MPVLYRTLARTLGVLLCLTCAVPAWAQGFSALVSPPRFEANAKPGETYRNVVEINNVSAQSAHFTVQTADWTFKPDATVTFADALAPNSCRPWVGIEAADITVAANAKRRYRFEVRVPADAPAGECRFAIMIEGDAEAVPGSAAIPVSGRIGVIVYLRIGDAAPVLDIVGTKVAEVDGRRVPVLSVRNRGNAHGRLQGFVDGRDADGRGFAFAPSTLPILPGETRDIALAPQADTAEAEAPVLRYPVTLSGHLDSSTQKLEVEQTFAQ